MSYIALYMFVDEHDHEELHFDILDIFVLFAIHRNLVVHITNVVYWIFFLDIQYFTS